MNDISNPKSSAEQEKTISIGKAIFVGQLVVNLPVLIIILVVSGLGILLTLSFLAPLSSLQVWILILGFVTPIIVGASAGWLWWSFSVPRWRRWALQNGAPEDELQARAVVVGLVWPKGSFFEKTEFRLKK